MTHNFILFMNTINLPQERAQRNVQEPTTAIMDMFKIIEIALFLTSYHGI